MTEKSERNSDGDKYLNYIAVMARKARIHIPGIFQHVMARGIEGRDIFSDDEDRYVFLSLLDKSIKQSGYRCLAWALMKNHYHVLLRISDEPLGNMMRQLNSGFARYYGKRHDRKGYLFQDRFRSIATIDKGYVEKILRYIHLNPWRAKICTTMKSLALYPWSGHSVLMGNRTVSFQDTQSVLKRFGKDLSSARSHYEAFVLEGTLSDRDADIISSIRGSNRGTENVYNPGCWVIGDQEFVAKALRADVRQRARMARYVKEGWTLKRLLGRVCEALSLQPEQVLAGSKRRTRSDARKLFCYFAHRRLQFSSAAIGDFLGISPAAVSISSGKGKTIFEKAAIKIVI